MTAKKVSSPAAKAAVGIPSENMARLERAFNEWERRYVNDPAAFTRDFEDAAQFQAEIRDGKVPSYGGKCASYLAKLLTELGD